MPAPTLTDELKNDLKLLKVGTVVESVTDYYSGRMTKKERKPTLADELLSDPTVRQYRKRKVQEIEQRNHPAGNEKWKNKGRQTFKRAKQRRQY
ncbi:Fcf2 pre-rRNA processing [Corchorus olitorius]|uniref:Fcf2 pre-rRNA processing n=1 Tax=Corchorus olitorius TaxID=93759 RepID=A0A1R3GKK9_9ROSI|nr:Fcf2 pre-rRNA processing [Corchorus olitorius]